jgi:Arc/MetJ-type ribon-helix-helix transcriptional regulator
MMNEEFKLTTANIYKHQYEEIKKKVANKEYRSLSDFFRQTIDKNLK